MVRVYKDCLSGTLDCGAIGVDLGVEKFAALSDGTIFPPLKPHRAVHKRLVRLSRSLSRKQKGSANRAKAKIKLARLHNKIACVRKDALHKLSHTLAMHYETIGIENLHVKGMMRNKYLSRSIADASFGEFRRQLEYKAGMTDAKVIAASRWFPSSKLCSSCGYRLDVLPLHVRDWICPECGSVHDRDVNAAINLKKMAVSPTVTACGEEGSGPECKKPTSVKQETIIIAVVRQRSQGSH